MCFLTWQKLECALHLCVFQLLEASVGFHAKDAVCTKTLDFLCGTAEGLEQQEAGPPSRPDEVRSHQVLEMLLYKVMLNIQSGRFKTALNFIQVRAVSPSPPSHSLSLSPSHLFARRDSISFRSG